MEKTNCSRCPLLNSLHWPVVAWHLDLRVIVLKIFFPLIVFQLIHFGITITMFRIKSSLDYRGPKSVLDPSKPCLHQYSGTDFQMVFSFFNRIKLAFLVQGWNLYQLTFFKSKKCPFCNFLPIKLTFFDKLVMFKEPHSSNSCVYRI